MNSTLDAAIDIMINYAVMDTKLRIDFLAVVPDQAYPPPHYYYGRIKGFRSESYRVEMIPCHEFTPRTQYVKATCCVSVNRIEELLYF